MIKLESAHIEEVRGIRNLDIDFHKSTFAIAGPNGSGKSGGVIDAIEFALTGSISRLMGRGTKGLSVAEHGPHVDKANFPDAAFVRAKVFLTDLGKSATVTRKLKTPTKVTIEPPDPDIAAALTEVAAHPETVLSRREILRFILVEPTKRSEEIQTTLKLDDIGRVRTALNTAQNRLQKAQKTATAQVQSSREALLTHLQLPSLNAEGLLGTVNNLPELAELTSDTKLDDGLTSWAIGQEFNRQSALRDLSAASAAIDALQTQATTEAAAIVVDIEKLQADPALLMAVQRRFLVEMGLELVDGPECPLCDHAWDSEAGLRAHLAEKLAKSKEAHHIRRSIMTAAGAAAQAALRLSNTVAGVQRLAAGQGGDRAGPASRDLKDRSGRASNNSRYVGRHRGAQGSARVGLARGSSNGGKRLGGFYREDRCETRSVATVDAQTFLTTAQLRLRDTPLAFLKAVL